MPSVGQIDFEKFMFAEKDETGLRYLREIIALLIAAVILGGFLLMIRDMYLNIGDEHHQERKDLLQIFTGFLGIVIGYYFNRVSTEARAEKAETAARRANETVQGVNVERADALRESSLAKEAAVIAKSELRNLLHAARTLPDTPDKGQTRAAVSGSSSVEDELKILQDAVERAKKFCRR